jgi:GxxExxY protein
MTLSNNDLMMNQDIPENDLAHRIIGFAIEIHKALGPGLQKSAYRECLEYELTNHDLAVEKNKPMPVNYKDLQLDYGYQLDLLVDHKVVVEVMTCDQISDQDVQRLLRFLKLGDYKLGLIINFNSSLLKNGIRRVNNMRNVHSDERMGTLYH